MRCRRLTPTARARPSGVVTKDARLLERTVSTFVGRSTTQVLVGKTEVVSTVDVIATDFGRVKVIPSRWVPTDLALLIDPDYVAVAFFRSFRTYMMARIGDAETFALDRGRVGRVENLSRNSLIIHCV